MNINEMAREAEEFAAQNAVCINKTYSGSEVRDFEYHDLLYRRFAELVAAAARADEREACANMCMAVPRTGAYFARLIRARGTT